MELDSWIPPLHFDLLLGLKYAVNLQEKCGWCHKLSRPMYFAICFEYQIICFHLVDIQNPHYLDANNGWREKITCYTRRRLVLEILSIMQKKHVVNLLILFAIDVYKSALSLIACVPTVKVLVTPLFHRDTEAGVAREFMFCKWWQCLSLFRTCYLSMQWGSVF